MAILSFNRMKKPKLVVLSGAGISAESGLKTFRGADGLWEGFRVEDVATPEAWRRNPALVLEFYNQRRKQAKEAQPNAAHLRLVEWEKHFDVHIITQNVDNLHERAGSSQILHLHGQLFQMRSTKNPDYVFDMEGWELNLGYLAPDGSQLRPHIVWFGEEVPMMEPAIDIASDADFLVVVGTSLQVYPAASLVQFVPPSSKIFVVDPDAAAFPGSLKARFISEPATTGLATLETLLLPALD